jgi:hypothetical protein
MYSRSVKKVPGKPILTAMATPYTGHAARANTFFGWGKINSIYHWPHALVQAWWPLYLNQLLLELLNQKEKPQTRKFIRQILSISKYNDLIYNALLF